MRVRFAVIAATVLLAAGCRRHQEGPQVLAAGRGADIELARDFRLASARVPGGATLASVLRAAAISDDDVAAVVTRASAVFDLRKFRASQPYRIEQWLDGRLRALEYEIDGDRFLRVARTRVDPTLVAELVTVEKTGTVDVVRGTIDRATPSLFAAIEAAGETVDLGVRLADVFSGEIDFNVDLRPGDHFELLVEKK